MPTIAGKSTNSEGMNAMIRTPITELLGIQHPVAHGGMASVTLPELAAAVSSAGGLGAVGGTLLAPDAIHKVVGEIRARTDRPFALNFLLFSDNEAGFTAALEVAPPVLAFAWPRGDQDLAHYFDRAHDAGCLVLFQTGNVAEARRGVAAGADVIVAQGTEGGGHVGWMASLALVPMIVDAVAPVPVLAAGGIADGRGLAAALALGAGGVLLGTRFLATQESALHPNFKQAILDSDGHDTVLTDIPDVAGAKVWPGAMARARRNRFIARWAGRDWDLRLRQADVQKRLRQAHADGDIDEASLLIGQDAGLINDLPPAGDIVRRMVAEAEQLLSVRLPGLIVTA
jgi:NAD(P)H-dependent flavin oxidoreductase YrpB (nitropropane dioxygenase family)